MAVHLVLGPSLLDKRSAWSRLAGRDDVSLRPWHTSWEIAVAAKGYPKRFRKVRESTASATVVLCASNTISWSVISSRGSLRGMADGQSPESLEKQTTVLHSRISSSRKRSKPAKQPHDRLAAELADLAGVIAALLSTLDLTWNDLFALADRKRAERGGFGGRLLLEYVVDRLGTIPNDG